MTTTGSLRGIVLIVCAAVLWGTTGTAQSFAPLTLSSYWVGASRLFIASLFFIAVLVIQKGPALRSSRANILPWGLLLIAGLAMASYNLLFFAAIRATSVALGTALALGSGPVWAGLMQICMTRQSPAPSWWIAVAVAVTGLVIATVSADVPTMLTGPGILLCLFSGASYAVYAIITKRIVSLADPALTTGLVFTFAAIVALPGAYLLAGKPSIQLIDISVLLWLGIVATGVAYLLFSIGLKYVSSATGVALALAEPVAAVVFALLIVGERPGGISIIGMGVVLIGLGLLVRIEVRN